jgi:DNA-binding CsgD family transcriptional regulator
LSLGAIYVLLAARLRLSVPRSVLVRIHDTCRGNPLFALEIARALKERGLPEPGQPFEIPSDAEAIFAVRLDQLSGDTLDALAVAATTASPTCSLLSRTHANALEPAVHAGIIRLEGERIYFTHPLLASAAYARLDSAARRKLHRRIAAAVTDPEERARHLALAADAPDGEVSTALDKAAEQAAARGAYAAAAELAELAVKLMPPDDANHLLRKRLAAHHHFFAGDIARAREILETLIGELPPGVERARALLQLAEARSGEVVAMLSLREQAALEAVGDDLTLAVAHRWLSQTLFVSGDPGRALDHARRALAAAERSGDTRATALSLAYVVWLELWNDRVTPGLLERALALEEGAGYLRLYESPSVVEAIRLMVLEDDLDGSRERLSAAESIARDHGDDESRALLLIHLAMVEYRAGGLDHAVRYATESIDLREQFGFSPGAHLYVLALAEAARGRIGTARAAAERGRELCEQVGNELYAVSNLRALGFLALSTGDWPVAAQILAPLPERLAARGYGRVTVLQVLPDAIEALIAVGEVGRAATQLRDLDETARLGITYAHARAARCRGLLAAAERDYATALEAFEDALSAHEELPDPLERGRTLLALGQVRRRLKQKRLAKEALEDALAIFEQTGAVVWAGRARVELERIGLRRRAPDELTETEQQVAELAAAGLKNREIAAQAFLTPKSVEDVLQRVYRKLDIHSRAELGARMATTVGRG